MSRLRLRSLDPPSPPQRELDWWVSPFGKIPVVSDPAMPLGLVQFVAPDGQVLLTFENVAEENP